MKASISTRIAESARQKDKAAMDISELAPVAAKAGFKGMSIRASQVSVDSPPDRVQAVAAALRDNGLEASMIMGNVPLAANTPDAPDCLRDIGAHLDLAEALGAKLVRVMMHGEDDIPHAQRSADQAAERGITLAHQTHWGTMAETVDDAIDLAKRVGRPNFGITYEPANLLADGSAYGADAVEKLAPHIVNAYFQNVRLNPDGGALAFNSRYKGAVGLDYVALDDPNGIDIRPIIEALDRCGYTGWFSVHQPLRDGQTVADAVDEGRRVILPLLGAG